ncbi:hypothetical protein LPJ57_003855, partial [Coemansia sp. RSA 486]
MSSSEEKPNLQNDQAIDLTAKPADPETDLATAILRKKAAPNKLMIDEAINDDNSVA